MVLGIVVAAAVAGTTAAGVLGEAALPKELPKPPNPNGVLLPPIAVPALALKLAKLNALATGSTLAAAGMELVVVLLTLIELLLVAVVIGLTVFNASGTSFLGCSCAAFAAVPKPAKILGAAAAPAPAAAVLPKLKVEVPAKKDVAGFAAVSLAPIAGLIVAVVTVVAVVFTNGLLWLKLKEVGVAGVAKLDTSIVAAGLDAVGLANAAASASAWGLVTAGAAAAACVDLWATVGLAAAAAAAAVAAAADFFFWSALSFVSSITSDLRPTRSGRCGLITCILC